METLVDKKEIEVFKKQIEKAAKFSGSLQVVSKEDYEAALEEGKTIKVTLDKIVERKEEITKPLNAALKSVRSLFKPLEDSGSNALTIVKSKMVDFARREAFKAEEQKRKLAERVERGTMTAETAVRKIEAVKEPEKTVATETAKATVVVRKAYRVTDKSKIPLEYMEPNMVAIKAQFRAGHPIAGVEEYETEDISIG